MIVNSFLVFVSVKAQEFIVIRGEMTKLKETIAHRELELSVVRSLNTDQMFSLVRMSQHNQRCVFSLW